MTAKSIDYYDSMSSPWTYLGHLRFVDLCRRFGLTINHKPMDLLKVWSVSGGLPLIGGRAISRLRRCGRGSTGAG